MKNKKIINKMIGLILFTSLVISIIFFAVNDAKFGIIISLLFLIMVVIFLYLFGDKLFLEKDFEQEVVIDKKYIDELTQLPNRQKFFEDLPEAKGLIIIDLDDFSLINTIYGKDTGDEVLKRLSNKLLKSDCIDNLYRIAGDEFAIITTKENDLKGVGECILDIINNFFITKDEFMIQTTATIGVSYTHPLIETADLALKYGKKNRLNLVLYSNNFNLFGNDETFVEVAMRLKSAIKNHNIVPFFQCIKNRDNKTVKYEALMRIKEGDKYLLPTVFLSVSKRIKLYQELTIQMVTKTFDYMIDKNIPFSINLNYEDIINKKIYDFILDKIEAFPHRRNIIIELSDISGKNRSSAYVQKFIEDVHNRGAKIAIDNFGRDYANFTSLEKWDIDILKIDGELISEILSSDNAFLLVRAIVEFCDQNKITSIAQFVSNEDIYRALKEIGVDEFEGFYFCKPKEHI